jgi:hypothetical protein
MSQSVYSAEVETCPKCKGMGMISIGGNTLKECTCLILARLKKYVEPISKYSFLTQTKLLKPLCAGSSLLIQCDDHRVWNSHLLTALVWRKDVTKSWKIIGPNELMSMSFDRDSTVTEKLFTTDLLIINAPSFLYYEKASLQHEFVISQRNSMNKPTWFIVKNRKRFLDIKTLESSFRNQLTVMPAIALTYAETEPLIKKSSKPSVSIVQGEGIPGIDKGLLVFHPEMDDRIKYLKEHVNEWKRKASVDNGDDPQP